MPDQRQHRGPHPHDGKLFERRHWPALQAATADLSWLLSQGYSQTASLKLVGDRYELKQRQRLAVGRSACSDQSLSWRKAHHVLPSTIQGHRLDVDGFNLLLTVEAALSHGIIIAGRDGCFRDMASVHGTFRMVEETIPALRVIGSHLAELNLREALWLLDSPVSNSGRLAAQIRQLAEENKWNWRVELATDPDAILKSSTEVVVSADSVVLDQCKRWTNLGAEIINGLVDEAGIVPMHKDRE